MGLPSQNWHFEVVSNGHVLSVGNAAADLVRPFLVQRFAVLFLFMWSANNSITQEKTTVDQVLKLVDQLSAEEHVQLMQELRS